MDRPELIAGRLPQRAAGFALVFLLCVWSPQSAPAQVVVDDSGKVGIGTTNPVSGSGSVALHIKGANPDLRLERSSTGRVWEIENNEYFYIYDRTAGVNRFSISTAGNVGIGTTAPGTQLTIQRPTLDSSVTNNGSNAGLRIVRGAGGTDSIQLGVGLIGTGYQSWIQSSHDDGTKDLLIQPNGGNVGIGTTSPSWKLEVNGNAGLTGPLYYRSPTQASLGYYLCWNASSWEVTYASSCAPSSSRFKENIADLNYGLAEISHLHPISYTYKPEYKLGANRQLGFLAEEVGTVLPEVVAFEPNGKDATSIDYGRLTVVLVQAIKEQQAQLRALEQQLGMMQKDLAAFQRAQPLSLVSHPAH